MAFPDSFMQELLLRNDISEIASLYITLKRRGRNMVGLCPFHGEKTPSFNIYTESNSFYCFGCGVGGNVISFVMKIENLDFVEAVKFLAQRCGMEMPENSSYDDSLSKLRMRIYEANREAARFFYSSLNTPNGKAGLDYLHSRMLSDRTIRHFGLGFADDNWTSLCTHLKNKGFSENEIVSANLGLKRKNGKGIYDRFTNRVMFPIIDLRGNVIAFGGRIMTDQKPKYLNTSDTPVFKKSENLFSLNNAKTSGQKTLILCEGYMDVIALNQAGFTNTVATLGTALTNEQAILMKRYADEVIICYDADGAGQKATARAIEILRKSGMPIKILTVPNGKDPDEFIKLKGENGHAAFQQLIDKCGNDIEYKMMRLKESYNVNTTDGRLAYINEVMKLIVQINSSVEKDIFVTRVCKEFGIDKNAFYSQMQKISRRTEKQNYKEQNRQIQTDISRQNDRVNVDHHKMPRSSSAEEKLLVYLIDNPNEMYEIEEKVPPTMFKNSLMKRFYEYTLDRLKNGLEPLTNLSADFSQDEVSSFYRLMSSKISRANTREAMLEYIDVIIDENSKKSNEEIAEMSIDDFQGYLDKIRQQKE